MSAHAFYSSLTIYNIWEDCVSQDACKQFVKQPFFNIFFVLNHTKNIIR